MIYKKNMLFIIKLLKNTLKEEKIKEVFILTWIKKQMMTKHENVMII